MALVSTSTRAVLSRAFSSLSTAMPSMPGSLRSSRITSGASSAASASAVAPSPASPATSIPSCTSSSTRSPRRTTGWSSTISTEMGGVMRSPSGRLPRARSSAPWFPSGRTGWSAAARRRGALAHRGQPEPAGRRVGREPVAVVGHLQHDQARGPWTGRPGRRTRPACRSALCRASCADPVQRRLRRGAERRQVGGGERDRDAVRPPGQHRVAGAAIRPARRLPGPAGPGRRSPRGARRGLRRRARRPPRSRP